MGIGGYLDGWRTATSGLAPDVTGEGRFLNAAMDSSLFESFQGRGLCVRQSWLRAALGEDPTPTASLDKKKFDAMAAQAVTDCGHLFATAHLPELRKLKELTVRLRRAGLAPSGRDMRFSGAHGSRVRDAHFSG